jgi:quercetin dioxygenase-like cupin family protein
MSEKTINGRGVVLQPEEGQSDWQPNGYSIIKLGPKHAGPENVAMGVHVFAPVGHVREHSHDPNQEILFCFAGRGRWDSAPVRPGHHRLRRAGSQAQDHQ